MVVFSGISSFRVIIVHYCPRHSFLHGVTSSLWAIRRIRGMPFYAKNTVFE